MKGELTILRGWEKRKLIHLRECIMADYALFPRFYLGLFAFGSIGRFSSPSLFQFGVADQVWLRLSYLCVAQDFRQLIEHRQENVLFKPPSCFPDCCPDLFGVPVFDFAALARRSCYSC